MLKEMLRTNYKKLDFSVFAIFCIPEDKDNAVLG